MDKKIRDTSRVHEGLLKECFKMIEERIISGEATVPNPELKERNI